MLGWSWLALYGAIVSTVSVAWCICRDLTDKPNVHVDVGIGFSTSTQLAKLATILGQPVPPPQDYLLVTVVNKGRRPVTIESWGITLPDHEHEIIPPVHGICTDPGLPAKLSEGDRMLAWAT